MYTYLYAVGKLRSRSIGKEIIDISAYSLKSISTAFSSLTIVINDSLYDKEIAIELDVYRNEFSTREETIQLWLDEKVNDSLIYHTDIPSDKYKKVILENTFNKGYDFRPANINLANDRQATLESDSAPDICLYHRGYKKYDYKTVKDHSLFIINGCFVRATSREEGIYLLGAGKDYIEVKKDIRVNALNFEKIGSIKTYPITKEMITKGGGEDEEIRHNVSLNVKGDLKNKTVWLVFNGQLCCDTDIVYKRSENEIVFDYRHINMLRHHYTYRDYIITPKFKNIDKIDEYVNSALLLHSSFIVVIDNPSVSVIVEPLTTFTYPNVAHTTESFNYPIVLENGLFPSVYRMTYGIKQWVLYFDLRLFKRYIFPNSDTVNNPHLFDTINNGMSGRLPKAFFFKIMAIVKKGVK